MTQPVAVATRTFNARISEAVKALQAHTGTTDAELAALLGIKLKQVGRKLKGESGYDVPDLMALAIRFGVGVLPIVANRDDLFPEEVRTQLAWTDTPKGATVTFQEKGIAAQDIDWEQVLPVVALRMANDDEVPRRIATRGDLRRHLIVALATAGIEATRAFTGTSPAIDLAVDVGPQLSVACFVGAFAVGKHETALVELEALLDAMRAVAGTAPSTVVVAAISPEVAEALAALCDGRRLEVGGGLELQGEDARLRIEIDALSHAGTDICIALDVRQDLRSVSVGTASPEPSP